MMMMIGPRFNMSCCDIVSSNGSALSHFATDRGGLYQIPRNLYC